MSRAWGNSTGSTSTNPEPTWQGTKNPESYYTLYLADWSARKLSEISKTDVQDLHADIAAEKSGVTANRVYQLLRTMYNRTTYWGDFEGDNPAADIERYPEKSRDRFLQPDELLRFFLDIAQGHLHVTRAKHGTPSTPHSIRASEIRVLRRRNHYYSDTPYAFLTERGLERVAKGKRTLNSLWIQCSRQVNEWAKRAGVVLIAPGDSSILFVPICFDAKER